MKLRFFARGGALVSERNSDGSAMPRPAPGLPIRYVGRQFDAETRGNPAVAEPYECESDTGEADYLARCCRDGDLFAADAATAAAVGVPFVAVEVKDGLVIQKANAPSRKVAE